MWRNLVTPQPGDAGEPPQCRVTGTMPTLWVPWEGCFLWDPRPGPGMRETSAWAQERASTECLPSASQRPGCQNKASLSHQHSPGSPGVCANLLRRGSWESRGLRRRGFAADRDSRATLTRGVSGEGKPGQGAWHRLLIFL